LATSTAARDFRAGVLRDCGAPPSAIDELLAYGAQPCHRPDDAGPIAFPLPDEPHVGAWQQYEAQAREQGAVDALRAHLVQLRFPVRAGISEESAYRDATRKGRFDAADAEAPAAFARPDLVRLDVRPTIAGRVPIIVCGDRRDFETMVQALTSRNEPEPVPAAMGACLVKGLNNWSRVAAYRAGWEREHPDGAWSEEFARLIPRKELYQDRFIILSTGPYSATPAAAVGLDDAEWLERSLALRREHELTHYFVYRAFGVMRTHAFDEIVADFIGTSRAFGTCRDDLVLRFLGLERFPEYRPGGRLEMYRSNPPLSDEATAVVRTMTYRAVKGLNALTADWTSARWDDLHAVGDLTFRLSQLTLEELASGDLRGLVAGTRA
jgi:hypothetical protein